MNVSEPTEAPAPGMLKGEDEDRFDTSVKLVNSETEIPDISRNPEGESKY